MNTDYNRKPKQAVTDFGWYNLGYLPHFDGGETAQFVTFRLSDSMPHNILNEWRKLTADDIEFRKKIEGYLDAGHGECWLRIREIATIVQDTLIYHHDREYSLISWVIMPNHVHVLLRPLPLKHLNSIMHSIKSYSAQMANKVLGRKGQFWQHESFDRYIRSEKHFHNVIEYIELNPVKAGLCNLPQEWEFSSRFIVQRKHWQAGMLALQSVQSNESS